MASIGPSAGLTRFLPGPVGAFFNRMLSAVGVAERVAESDDFAISAHLKDRLEISPALITARMDRMFGRTVPPGGYVAPPFQALHQDARTREELVPRGFKPLGGNLEGLGNVGRSLERASQEDPLFRVQLEIILKGQVIPSPDGRTDCLTLWRQPQAQVVPGGAPGPQGRANGATGASPTGLPVLNTTNAVPGMPLPPPTTGTILEGLRRMEANVAGLAMQLTGKGGNPSALAGSGVSLAPVGQALSATGALSQSNLAEVPLGQGMMQPGSLDGQPLPTAPVPVQELSDTMKQEMILNMMKQLQRFYQLLSELLSNMHEMQKNAIGNIV
jgi:hypothetical protein